MEQRRETSGARGTGFKDPKFLNSILTDARLAWLWLIVRVSLGWIWFEAGRRQLHAHAQGAVPFGGPEDTWIAQAAAIAQTLAGIALILGAFVGIAAFAGGLLGSGLVSPAPTLLGPLLFAAAVWLVLAWKTAGWIGLDRWLLPLLGMPWRGGNLFRASLPENERTRNERGWRPWTERRPL